MPARPEVVANHHCQTGECPLWDPAHECLYWTDIPAGRLYKYDPRTGKTATLYEGPPVGGFTQEADGSLMLFRVHDIARLSRDGHVRPVIELPHDGADRFNDVIADPEGRVFAGRMAREDARKGTLMRIDPDGSVHTLFSGCAVPNGMGFSLDLKIFYFTCTRTKSIYRFHYDRATGEISDRKTLHEVNEEGNSRPDGLTVDEEGNLWSARYEGSAVVKHAPDGRVLERIPVPVSRVTSIAFGGLDMDTLFITTAGGEPGKETEDGALFSLKMPVRGRLEFRSRILLA